MTRLIFVRHGQSLGNLNRTFLGHTDLDLSEKGYAQAEKTAAYIAARYTVDEIYASDLLRAYHTGEAAAKKLSLPVKTDRRLREIFAGAWENRTFDDIEHTFRDDYAVWQNDIGNACCTDGESTAELFDRVLPCVREIAEQNDRKTVLVATHATVIRALTCEFLSIPLSQMHTVAWVGNASVSTIRYDAGKWTVEVLGDDSFLGELSSRLPKNV